MKNKKTFLLLCIMHYALCTFILAFPIETYDFTLPHTTPSAIEAGMGGLNVASVNDSFLPISNPSLLKRVRHATLAFTFGTAPRDYDEFTELLKAEPLLQGNTLRGLSYQAKNFGLAYKNLALYEANVDSLQTYTSYSLDSYTIAFADSVGRFDWGISGKFLTGRLIYLQESTPAEPLTAETFIDKDALGYSFDLGLSTSSYGMTYGFMLYDIYSGLHWEGQSTAHLRTRLGTGADYTNGNNSMGVGINSHWWFRGESFYNAYYSYKIVEQSSSQFHQSLIRFGVVSSSFSEQDQIIFCFGASYGYKMISLDIGLQSRGIKANETQVFFTLTMGE